MIPARHPWSSATRWRTASFWIAAILILSHLVLSIAASRTQAELYRQQQNFLVFWNTGGAAQLASRGITPDQMEEARQLRQWLSPHVDNHLIYRVWILPEWFHWSSLLLSLFLQPGWLSLLALIWGISWSLPRLESLLGRLPAALLFAGGGVIANTLYALVSQLTDAWRDTPYCGASGALAFVLGIILRLDRTPIPVQPIRSGKTGTPAWPLWIWIILYALAEAVLNWIVNPAPHRLAFLISLGIGAIAYYVAHRLPRLFHQTQAAPRAAAKIGNASHSHLAEGWRLAQKLDLESAAHELQQGLSGILRAIAPDLSLAAQHIERITAFHAPIPIDPLFWYQWGERLENLKQHSLSITCLEQVLQSAATRPELARPAALKIATQRLANHLHPEKALSLLKKICTYSETDPIGRQAKRLLDEHLTLMSAEKL